MITCHISSANRAAHRIDVRIDFPAGSTELVFPSWAPGSYLQREFARNVRDIWAHSPDGTAVEIVRRSRNEWQAKTAGAYALHYQVYAREKSVRTPFLDEDLLFFVPTNLLVFDRERRQEPVRLRVWVPEGHTGVCPLGAPVAGPGWAEWGCGDIDILYDSPVAAGRFGADSAEVRGVQHHHFIEPGHDGDPKQMIADLAKIVAAAADLFGGNFPYPAYTFITLLQKDGHGGLEHLDSSVLLRPRRSFSAPKDYEEFLTLAAHEHFHAWNVKRIRPDTLSAPFAYERENYTKNLWWLEGGTVYYEERIVLRAGLVTEKRHIERLCNLLKRLDRTAGRWHQSMEDSSFDAWIKLYRPGEDSQNSGVSYYLKGAVVAWALDLELLHRSGGRCGIDDLMRALWEQYAAKGLPFPEEGTIERIAAELACGDTGGDAGGAGAWGRWWDLHLRGTAEVQIGAALAHAGLEVVRGAPGAGSWLGVGTAGDRLVVTSVTEGGAVDGVLTPGDEILAMDGDRIWGAELGERLKSTAPGSHLTLLFSRDGRVRSGEVCTHALPTELRLVSRADATERQRQIRACWLWGTGRRTEPEPGIQEK